MRSRPKPPKVPPKPAPNAGLALYCSRDQLASRWVRLVLNEKEVDRAVVHLLRSGQVDEDFLVLNPAQSLPTLADREGVLTNACVIAEYLDERYPHPPLMPAQPSGRARVRQILHRFHSEWFPAAEAADRKALAGVVREAQRHLSAQGYFLGLEFSLADCAWAVLLWRLEHGEFTWPTGSELVRRYGRRLFSRRAFGVLEAN